MHLKEIENLQVKEKEQYIAAFIELIKEIKENRYDFIDKTMARYTIVNEQRLRSHFIHVVPKEVQELFEEVKKKYPSAFLGFSVLVGDYKGREVRVSCFGVPCALLTKALINSNRATQNLLSPN